MSRLLLLLLKPAPTTVKPEPPQEAGDCRAEAELVPYLDPTTERASTTSAWTLELSTYIREVSQCVDRAHLVSTHLTVSEVTVLLAYDNDISLLGRVPGNLAATYHHLGIDR